MTAPAAALDPATAAALLDREAGLLTEVLDGVALASGPDTWQGPAADRFADALDGHRRSLRAAADDLRALARRMAVGMIAGGPEPGRRWLRTVR